MTKAIIAPSILSADLACLGEETSQVLSAGADWIHFDVMDNHYVPNLTFGPAVCAALRRHGIKAPIDVHLMVEPVDELIVQFAKSGATSISFHPEASRHVDRSLQLIKEVGCSAGIALNPTTSLDILPYVIEQIDLILLMSVNPGFGGQPFISAAYDKVKAVRTQLDQEKREIRLAVDGGIDLDNIAKVQEAGADTFVMGSAIFQSNDYKQTISEFRKLLK